ncbi:MAG: NAD(+)/NADH kinase [Candidatus Nezhaarchaeota archaeon]|nr:NAD(+)/NADH kinase [Candidatus Nezhaarchaeota archaeon]
MKLGIVSRTDLKEALELVRRASRLLNERGVRYIIEHGTASKLGLEGAAIEDLDTNAIIAIGGDGTILRLLKRLKKPIPILGVKLGKICFLGEVWPEELDGAIERLLESKFFTEEVMKIMAETRGGGIEVDAVNEVAIISSQPAKVVELKASVRGVEIYAGLADGVIVATPIGSTGYALSAHGPIVDPALEAMLLVLLNPLNLGYRPLVISAEAVVEIKIGRPGGMVVIDGDLVCKLEEGDWVKVRKSPRKAVFIRLSRREVGFYERLKKLFEIRTRMGRV